MLRSHPRSLAEIHIDYLRPERARTYELIGSQGMIHWQALGKTPERSTVRCYQRQRDRWETYTFESDLNEMYVAEMRHFLDCLAGRAHPAMDAQRGRDILALALAARQSAHSKQPVSLTSRP